MCGICGIWQLNSVVDEDALRQMSGRLAHRGPDDSGTYISADGRAGLGFRRLAIIDLSPGGHQPMTNEDSSLWIVFNGEIYNYPALRKALVNAGHEFRSTSDTEVILHGYEEWGEGILRRLRGMFAFALWNEREHSLLLARDRLGIKPLHYYWDGKRFAFASEIKALLALPDLKAGLDHSAIWDYFTYLYIPAPKTVYQSIRKLPPAHFLKLRSDFICDGDLAPSIQEYWDVTDWGAATLSRKDAAEAARARLRDAVQSHLIADVPVGVLLSGGLDSTAVTAMAAQDHSDPLMSFSIGFDVEEHSELHFAQMAAEAFGTRHHTRTVSRSDFDGAARQMASLYDEPFADNSGLPTLLVSQLAARHVKVVLAGDGGDETLAGYFRYLRWFELSASERISPALRSIFDKAALGVLAPLSGLRGVMGLIYSRHLHVHGKEGADRYGALVCPIQSFQKPYLLPDLAREFRGYDDYWYFRRYWRSDLDPLSRMQYVDLKTYLPDDILTKVDRASMAASLEVRVPFLDHEWVEFAASLPPEYRLNKSILRNALADVVPPAILTRPKKGFSSPVLDWQRPETRNGTRLGGSALWAARVYDSWQTLHGSPT